MVKSVTLLCCVVLLAAGSLARPVFPDDNFFDEWVKAEPTLRFVGNDLYGYIDGGAELFHEFGFKELSVQRYVMDDEEIVLETYEMIDPTAALGIYLMKCGTETPIDDVDARNSGSRYQFTIVKGSCFVQINNFTGTEALMPAMIAAANFMLAGIPEDAPVLVLKTLPEENIVPGSVRIIRGPYGLQPIFTFGEGDILQLGGKIAGAVANYHSALDSTYTRIVIPYPDAATASGAYKHLHANLDAYIQVIDTWAKGFSFKDYRGRFGRVELQENLLRIEANLVRQPAGK